MSSKEIIENDKELEEIMVGLHGSFNRAYTKILNKEHNGEIANGYYSGEVYSLNHKMGKCIILDHTTFKERCLTERRGTEDADALRRFFGRYNFKVCYYQNKTVNEIMEILEQAKNEDHTTASCFVLCVLTHGHLHEGNEMLFAYDGDYQKTKLLSPFSGDECKTLAGKPKIFFIQADRGDKFDKGVGFSFGNGDMTVTDYIVTQTLNEPRPPQNDIRKVPINYSIPSQADYFIACSTVYGYVAWRSSTKGSWFIQALCKTLEERAENLDLATILTIVCFKLSYYYSSISWSEKSNMKQVPSIYTTLTRRFYFSS